MGPAGWAHNFALFLPLPQLCSFFLPSLGGLSCGILVFEAPGPEITFGVLRLSCEGPVAREHFQFSKSHMLCLLGTI